MTPAEIYYEAACEMSNGGVVDNDGFSNEYSCHAVALVESGGENYRTDNSVAYGGMMTHYPSAVERAAASVNWPYHHFRTFMLLMASEAVK